MAHVKCCVPGCGKSRSDNVTLHKFPNPDHDADRFRTWVYNIGGNILALKNETILKYHRVCDNHFETKYRTRSKRLSVNAVPTLHMPGCSVTRNVMRDVTNQSQHCSEYVTSVKDVTIGQATTTMDTEKTEIQQPTVSAECSVTRNVMRDITNQSQYCSKSVTSVKDATIGQATTTMDTEKTEIQQPTVSADPKRLKLGAIYSTEASYLRRQIKKLQVAKDNYSSRLKKALKLSENATFQKALKKFTTFALIFTLMQFREIKKKKMGRRFSKQEKIMALSLYKQGPKAYRWLRHIFVLPSPLTLSRLVSRAALKAGINTNIFENLKKRVQKMNETDKLCILMFDEMAIAPHLDYNRKRDEIVGFVNNGSRIEKKIADHALVFMIRGITRNYKQPIAYSFCAGSTEKIELVRQIKEIVQELHKTGLNVLATVCDQGASNKSAINYLIDETKAKYLRNNSEWNKKTFEINGKEIIPLFDIPHLIKGIRNNLLNKNLIYVKDGEQKTAKWDHILKLYGENPAFLGLRMLPKLTEHHVVPNKIKKMKVKYATQVFSRSVAIAMGYLADKAVLPADCKETAEVLIFFDNLFDSMNGSYKNCQQRSGKDLLHAVTPNSSHHNFWKNSKIILKTIKYMTKDGKSCIVPSITNWINTLENTEYLIQKLFKDHNCRSIWLRHINQDPLENFFGCVRSHGARNINPTSANFETAFAALLINNVNSLHSAGANCEKDSCYMLKSLRKLFFNETKLVSTPVEINVNHLFNDNIILDFENKITNTKVKALIEYVTGFVVKRLRKVFKNCKQCMDCFYIKNTDKCNYDYIKMKDYSINKNYLTYPTLQAMKCFSVQQDMITYIIKDNINMNNIKNYIMTVLTTVVDYNFLKCPKHNNEIVAKMQDLACRFFLCNWCKDTNKLLKGVIQDFDEEDKIQKMAHQYFVKRNKK